MPERTMTFVEAMSAAETGFATWACKPHNNKWARHLEGTPIPNDLLVCIALEFMRRAEQQSKVDDK